eukprot:311839-Amphidinium_carterae.2
MNLSLPFEHSKRISRLLSSTARSRWCREQLADGFSAPIVTQRGKPVLEADKTPGVDLHE